MLWVYAENDHYFGPRLSQQLKARSRVAAAMSSSSLRRHSAVTDTGYFQWPAFRCGAVLSTRFCKSTI